jgi:predicted metal-dependent phosphoesterase TrpH
MYADLHLHTHFSDGTYSPEELAGHGRRCELAVMSLTDHDTVEGCARMATACAGLGIEFIPGTELTCDHDSYELHLLGYFIDPEHPQLGESMRRFQEVRQNRVREMVARLNKLSVKITADEVFALANCESPGRPHIARVLVKHGTCASLDDAFERFLKKGRPAWVPKFKLTAAEAVALIHAAGGLAVLAHPGLYRADEVIPGLADTGLDGLECFHSRHTSHATEHYLRIAGRFRLLPTGGSDCHGMNKGEPLIGSVRLAIDFVDRLKEAAAARRRGNAAANN